WYEIFKEQFPSRYEIEPEEVSENIGIDNAVTEIIENEKIAYLKIKSFSTDSTEEIMNFLKDVKDYPYLIIDIMDNGGGSDAYWKRMFFSLLSEDKKIESHFLVRGGEYSSKFLESELLSDFTKDNITKCPYYDDLPGEIKESFKYYMRKEDELSSEISIGFNEEIFLLVNENTSSAADTLVYFCQQTDIATVVGSKTDGAGIGVNP